MCLEITALWITWSCLINKFTHEGRKWSSGLLSDRLQRYSGVFVVYRFGCWSADEHKPEPQFGLAASSRPAVISCWVWGFGSIVAACGLLFCLSIIQNFHFSDQQEMRAACHYIHSQPEELLSLLQNKIWKNVFPPCDLWILWNCDLNSSLKVSRLPLRAKFSHNRFLFPPLEASLQTAQRWFACIHGALRCYSLTFTTIWTRSTSKAQQTVELLS